MFAKHKAYKIFACALRVSKHNFMVFIRTTFEFLLCFFLYITYYFSLLFYVLLYIVQIFLFGFSGKLCYQGTKAWNSKESFAWCVLCELSKRQRRSVWQKTLQANPSRRENISLVSLWAFKITTIVWWHP